MICEACQTENSVDNRFCLNCGNPLTLTCPNCSAGNPPGSSREKSTKRSKSP